MQYLLIYEIYRPEICSLVKDFYVVYSEEDLLSSALKLLAREYVQIKFMGAIDHSYTLSSPNLIINKGDS